MTEYYLFATHGDGAFSVIVEGLGGVYNKMIESMFGSPDDAPDDEKEAWHTLIHDPDEWTTSFDFGLWAWSHDFEDGSVTVQRVMDWAAVHDDQEQQ